MNQKNPAKKRSALSVFLIFLRYLILFLLIGATVLFATVLFSSYFGDSGEGGLDSFALGYAIFLIFAAVTYGALLFPSVLGLLFAAFYKKTPDRKRNLTWFIWLSVAAVGAFLLYLLSGVFFGVFN